MPDRLGELPLLDVTDETRDIDTHRAPFHTGRVLALKTAFCLCDGQLLRVARRDLIKIPPSNLGRLLRHFLSGDFFFLLCFLHHAISSVIQARPRINGPYIHIDISESWDSISL
jgi:hypothetical protein